MIIIITNISIIIFIININILLLFFITIIIIIFMFLHVNTFNIYSIVFFKCSNVLYIWNWVRQFFLNSHFFLTWMISLPFIKSDDSSLINCIKLVITFSALMKWHKRSYNRFHVKIDISRPISTIKDFAYIVGNSSKSSMWNHMLDFNVLKFFSER